MRCRPQAHLREPLPQPLHCRYISSRSIPEVAAQLGTPLSSEELQEALSVLCVGGAVAGSAEMLVRIDDVVAMWLLD